MKKVVKSKKILKEKVVLLPKKEKDREEQISVKDILVKDEEAVFEETKIKKPSRLLSFFISNKDKSFFTEHLAMMLSSGMDIISALDGLQKETHSGFFKKSINHIKLEVEEGRPLWQSLENSKLLSANIISLIRIGEQSGRLSENLKIVVLQQRKDQMFSSRIRSAMMYPIFVFSLTLTVGLGIAWFILPRLATVFGSMKMELPPVTKALIYFGNFLNQHGAVFMPSLAVFLIFSSYFIFFFKKTRVLGQWLLFHTPAVRTVIQQLQLARFGYILGTLLEAGLPVLEALSALARATTVISYQKFYLKLADSIEEGKSFQESFKSYKKTDKLVPYFIQQMVASGEQSGRLPETLNDIGAIFESKTDDTAKNLTVIMEPVLLVVVALGVLAVALAVILPIYSLIGGLQK